MKNIKHPWGQSQLLEQTPKHWVKRLVIKPGKRTSLQYHKYRDEFWYVLEGTGVLTYQNCDNPIKPGDNWLVNSFTLHRIHNTSKKHDLIIVEIATGKPNETDTIRVEDDYGRQTKT